MRTEKNSDNQLVQSYRKTIRGPSSDDPEFYDDVKNEWESLEKNDPDCEVYRIWQRCNANKKGRQARFSKKNVYLTWLLIKVDREERVIEYLKTFSQLPSKGKKRYYSWKRFKDITDRLIREGIIDSFDTKSVYRHKKAISWLEKETHKFKNFSPMMVEFIFNELRKKKYSDSALLKKKLKEFISADKYLGKIIDDIRESGGNIISHEIERKRSKTIPELKFYLRYLKDERLAFQKNGTIFLNCYDSKNNKKFMWIADSCYWKFGPKLEKGKVYNTNDFIRQDVVETWVETGNAKFI
jgi:hypothetical protein